MLAARLRLNEISAQMQISRDTVKTYFRRMIDKLALDGPQSLVSFANEKMAHCTLGHIRLRSVSCRMGYSAIGYVRQSIGRRNGTNCSRKRRESSSNGTSQCPTLLLMPCGS